MSSTFLYRFNKVEYNFKLRTHLMGILNVTPDSFSDGGRFFNVDEAIKQGQKMAEEGADFIDVGGESTRPGSEPVSSEEEIARVVPVIKELAKKVTIPISVDTYKSRVAQAALEVGAEIVNDVSAMTFDPEMASVIAKHMATAILMHIKGAPKTMQQNPVYQNVTEEVKNFLFERASAAEQAGIKQIIIDPGIGFGKKYEHNVQIFLDLRSFASMNYPLLIGPSRKSFLGKILDLPVDERLEGTAAAVTVSILNGANIIRVHDVKEMKRVALVSDALKPNVLRDKN